MYGYCLICRKKVEFTPEKMKQNPNGTYTVMGMHGSHKISRIVSKAEGMKMKMKK